MMKRCFLYFFLVPLFSSTLLAQPEVSSVSRSIYEIAFDSALAKLNKPQLAVYTGREYYAYFVKKTGMYVSTSMSVTSTGNRPGEHPFFITDEFRSETIEFGGVVYPSINLAYDICRSEVVVLTPQQKALVLPEGKVQRFYYSGHTFKFLKGVSDLKSDFYEILYWSDSTILCAKRHKNQTELWRTISDYYIILNNQAYPVSIVNTKSVGMKPTVLRILNEKEDQIRSYIRENNLKFTKSKKENSLIKVVEYYASLKTK